METLYVKTREEWRKWLADNHDGETEIWLEYYKKATSKPTIEYLSSIFGRDFPTILPGLILAPDSGQLPKYQRDSTNVEYTKLQ